MNSLIALQSVNPLELPGVDTVGMTAAITREITCTFLVRLKYVNR